MYLPTIVDLEDKHSAFKNRIRKNYQHIRKWAKRTQTDCFRIYDRDIKEYPVAIDFYAGRFLVHYFTFNGDDEDGESKYKNEVEETLSSLFAISHENIYCRSRIRRKKFEQYEKMAGNDEYFIATEYGIKFQINLHDYLDTGLFLDHRETRQLVAAQASGKRLLNLFAYTCSFSVHAACRGALLTKSVDMSNTYTAWGEKNFFLNNLSLKHHEIVREDCLKFLDREIESQLKYDIIVIDPPTISRSKKMTTMFDVQRDYPSLIEKALSLLDRGGTIIFSTNFTKFDFDEALFPQMSIKEITIIPPDFHNKKIHRCWKIIKKS